jgi:phosphoribosyl 1,2-cyclic phosphodiesterase
MAMEIVFWGVRGSIPCPGEETVRYGGNTPCVELRLGSKQRLVIIDAGSGIRQLGHHLVDRNGDREALEVDLFFTHTHIDHIIGFPFFTPLYVPGTRIRIYGPATGGDQSLEMILGGQMSYHYFPIRLNDLAVSITFRELTEGCSLSLDGETVVRACYLNHPLLCLAYRFEFGGRILCTAYDTEPYRNLFLAAPDESSGEETLVREGQRAADEANRRLEAFFQGADLLIYDAQFTAAEYSAKRQGWGHTAIEDAVETARRAGVKRLALFHHDPDRSDAQLDALAALYGRAAGGGWPEIFFAREGMRIDI